MMNKKIYDRALRVINSCTREDQLNVAVQYLKLIMKKYPNENYIDILNELQNKRDLIIRKI